jgi:hypothetical protein
MGEQRVTLERLDHGNHAVVATHAEVVALGDVVGQPTRLPWPNRLSAVSSTVRSRFWASSMTTKLSVRFRPGYA